MRPPNPGHRSRAIERLIGGRLRRRRIVLDLTQHELGALVGVAFQQIQSYELGAERTRPEMLLQLSRVLGVSLSYFFAEEDCGAGFAAIDCGDEEEPCDAAKSADMRELLRAFAGIEDEFLRRRVLSLVQSIADRERLGGN